MKNSYLIVLAFLLAAPVNDALAQLGSSELEKVSPAPIELEADAGLLKQYQQSITPEELREHLFIFASDQYEGRETGELGQKLAAEYIARHFFEYGLEGPVDDNYNPYFQPVALSTVRVGNVRLVSPDYEAEVSSDFAPMGRFNIDLEDAGLVFGGYGIESEEYNDLEGLDLEGKGVVLIDGQPLDKDGEPLLESVPDITRRGRDLLQKGAAFLILTYPTEEEYRSKSRFISRYSRASLSLGDSDPRIAANATFLASPEGVARLFGQTPAAYFDRISEAGKAGAPLGAAFATTVDVRSEVQQLPVSSENVLGYLEGTDLKEELVVITSHYDHVGIIDGKIHNGADDDGSGTVGLLEIAEAFTDAAKAGKRPRRSILFMTVTGEEKGLLGSRYYTDMDPVFPLENTVTNFNIDMIGRGDDEHAADSMFVYIIGSNMLSTELHNIHEQVAATFVPELLMDYKYNSKNDPQRFYYRSDHYNFAKNNIPVIFYFNGTHEDYHQHTDTPDKINYAALAKRAQLVFATAWEVANRDERPVVDQAEEE